jgi:membrane-bound ClpP family serine protease
LGGVRWGRLLKAKRKIQFSFLSAAIILLALTSIPASVSGQTNSQKAILIKMDSTIDYGTFDLLQEAATDIENGKASILLIELNVQSGYLSPSIQIIQRLMSLNAKVIVYVGPRGAAASTVGAYVAMASNILAMNSGTSIGRAGMGLENASSLAYLTNLMGGLATAKARNAAAAEKMVSDNLELSADTAYSQGICDLVVDSYSTLLAELRIDAQNVSELKPSQGFTLSQDTQYELLKLFANLSAIKYMFFAATILILTNFVFVLIRPRRIRTDEANERLLDFMRLEMQSLESSIAKGSGSLSETPLHTPADIRFMPPSKVNRIPTPLANQRLERPLEVKKR